MKLEKLNIIIFLSTVFHLADNGAMHRTHYIPDTDMIYNGMRVGRAPMLTRCIDLLDTPKRLISDEEIEDPQFYNFTDLASLFQKLCKLPGNCDYPIRKKLINNAILAGINPDNVIWLPFQFALLDAVRAKDIDQVTFLLQKGANPHRMYMHKTILEFTHSASIAQLLINHGAIVPKNVLAKMSIITDSPDLYMLYLKYGADVNATNFVGNTVLICLCQSLFYPDKSALELVTILIYFGARTDIQDSKGKTCLQILQDKINNSMAEKDKKKYQQLKLAIEEAIIDRDTAQERDTLLHHTTTLAREVIALTLLYLSQQSNLHNYK